MAGKRSSCWLHVTPGLPADRPGDLQPGGRRDRVRPPLLDAGQAGLHEIEAVKEALTEIGIDGMTVFEVRGHGRQKGHTETYRGREYTVDLLPKVKLELVVDDKVVAPAIDAILQSAATGKIGDGKIFLSKVDEAIRIRNQERGVTAL